MSVTSKITVLYENSDDPNAQFNMDYYVQQHMKTAEKAWSPYGLQGWEVIKLTSALGQSKSPYSVAAVVTFDSEEGAGKAVAAVESQEVLKDVPNFTNIKATLMLGHATGSWVR